LQSLLCGGFVCVFVSDTVSAKQAMKSCIENCFIGRQTIVKMFMTLLQ